MSRSQAVFKSTFSIFKKLTPLRLLIASHCRDLRSLLSISLSCPVSHANTRLQCVFLTFNSPPGTFTQSCSQHDFPLSACRVESQVVKICCSISDGTDPQEPCLLLWTDRIRPRSWLRNVSFNSALFIYVACVTIQIDGWHFTERYNITAIKANVHERSEHHTDKQPLLKPTKHRLLKTC